MAPGKQVAKKAPAAKATKAKKNVIKGQSATRQRKVRTSVIFRRPKTLRLARAPKYPRKAVHKRNKYVFLSFLSWFYSILCLFLCVLT